MRIAGAAAAYWAAVFALGFVLGTIRVLWLAPLIGLLPATALELPFMLAASWLVAGLVIARFGWRGAGRWRARRWGSWSMLNGATPICC